MISVLSPFLNSGCTSEYFNQSGNTPVNSTLLNIYVSGDIQIAKAKLTSSFVVA